MAIWIEYDSSDDSGAARWTTATDGQIDAIIAYAVTVLGKPDTTA